MTRVLFGWLLAVYAFLYAPIVFLIAFSFNDARLVTSWSGFSTRWYGVLWHDGRMTGAALLSVKVAAASATLALIVGTLAAIALSRFGRFRTRALLDAGLAAPLVLPDVVTGLSMLLFFIALDQTIGWPAGRGALTVTLAHATVSVAYVAVVVQARLTGLTPTLEEAAADLYAPPMAVFAKVTLPMLAPALISAWLLAFTLSLDDVVVASFTSGPGATTLPMVVFSELRLGATPELYALATLIVCVVAILLTLTSKLAKRR